MPTDDHISFPSDYGCLSVVSVIDRVFAAVSLTDVNSKSRKIFVPGKEEREYGSHRYDLQVVGREGGVE